MHQSIFGNFSRVRKSSAVRYFTLPQCGAVRYKVLVMAGVNSGQGQAEIFYPLVHSTPLANITKSTVERP